VIRFSPSEKNASCNVCQATAREINAAIAEVYARNQPAADALYKLIGGTEEDARRADELVAAYRYDSDAGFPSPPDGLMRAIGKSYEHAALTGHKLQRIVT
jgi:hypothetical protein